MSRKSFKCICIHYANYYINQIIKNYIFIEFKKKKNYNYNKKQIKIKYLI